MAHWAEIDSDSKVIRVVVGDNSTSDEGYSWLIENLGGTWIQTSYNTYGGKHSLNGTPLHMNYAAIGFSWDGTGFFAPQPFPSWKFDTNTYLWNPPVSYPDDGKMYSWNEETKSWQLVTSL